MDSYKKVKITKMVYIYSYVFSVKDERRKGGT